MADRYTISTTVAWRGPGVHTGETCAVTVHPVASGIQVSCGGRPHPLRFAEIVDVARCTGLRFDDRTILTVEHLLSALNGLGITDALLEVEGPEVPILDGSALPFAQGLWEAGRQHLGGQTRVEIEPVELAMDESRVRVAAGTGTLAVRIDYDHAAIGSQSMSITLTPDAYLNEVAPARTFGLLEDAERLRALGLALGASLDNTLVFSTDGPLTPPRFPDEPVRHKVLDLIGDLALSGHSIYDLAVQAERPGHVVNVAAAMRLRANNEEGRMGIED